MLTIHQSLLFLCEYRLFRLVQFLMYQEVTHLITLQAKILYLQNMHILLTKKKYILK